METNKLQIAIETLEKIEGVNDLLKAKLPEEVGEMELELDKSSLDDETAAELILCLMEGAAQNHASIQKFYEINQKAYSPHRSGAEVLQTAYQFVNNNWNAIATTIWVLRELGYLKVEKHPKVKKLIKMLKKKK